MNQKERHQLHGKPLQKDQKKTQHHGHSLASLIVWLRPPAGSIKLGIDGSVKFDPGTGGFGGLFRDEDG